MSGQEQSKGVSVFGIRNAETYLREAERNDLIDRQRHVLNLKRLWR